jgi:hypothetical protein
MTTKYPIRIVAARGPAAASRPAAGFAADEADPEDGETSRDAAAATVRPGGQRSGSAPAR